MNNKIDEIYQLLRNNCEPNYRDMNVLFYTLGTILIFTIFFTDKKDPTSYQYISSMIGMIIVFILLVFNSIKAIPPLELFLKIPLTKFILTFFFSGYIFYSLAEVSIIINTMFKVSSSNFKVSSSFGTFFYFLNHLVVIFFWYSNIIILALILLYLQESYIPEKNEFGEKKKESYWHFTWGEKCWYIIVFIAFSIILYHCKNIVLQEDALKYKIFRLALQYDFDGKHLCSNIEPNYSILYIGNQQNRVLVNSYYQANISNFEDFMTSREYNNFKNNKLNFDIENCIYTGHRKNRLY
ncbi:MULTISPECIES: hypothetical protein [Acinetobacter]|uniref:hypothetical protein n=1 Tax=Acinetobacter TaxID=469 RepID=UPI0015D26628|nr:MULTISPECIES: hypothetical protein [Acinetobacter]QOW52329.1 hypothetical protein G0030_03550 [Acinetobacter indicus]